MFACIYKDMGCAVKRVVSIRRRTIDTVVKIIIVVIIVPYCD